MKKNIHLIIAIFLSYSLRACEPFSRPTTPSFHDWFATEETTRPFDLWSDVDDAALLTLPPSVHSSVAAPIEDLKPDEHPTLQQEKEPFLSLSEEYKRCKNRAAAKRSRVKAKNFYQQLAAALEGHNIAWSTETNALVEHTSWPQEEKSTETRKRYKNRLASRKTRAKQRCIRSTMLQAFYAQPLDMQTTIIGYLRDNGAAIELLAKNKLIPSHHHLFIARHLEKSLIGNGFPEPVSNGEYDAYLV